MARVDDTDDSLDRFVLRHYRHDPERHERRHVPVAAFDNEAEALEALDAEDAELAARRSRGDADEREHFTVIHLPPGDHAEQRARRGASRMTSRRA